MTGRNSGQHSSAAMHYNNCSNNIGSERRLFNYSYSKYYVSSMIISLCNKCCTFVVSLERALIDTDSVTIKSNFKDTAIECRTRRAIRRDPWAAGAAAGSGIQSMRGSVTRASLSHSVVTCKSFSVWPAAAAWPDAECRYRRGCIGERKSLHFRCDVGDSQSFLQSEEDQRPLGKRHEGSRSPG